MLDLETKVRSSGLPEDLILLVKTRASQLNGCAFCIHMHTRDARVAGETEERLYEVLCSDGGGKSSAATKPVPGGSRVLRFYMGLAKWRA